jgi:hypothetical protein
MALMHAIMTMILMHGLGGSGLGGLTGNATSLTGNATSPRGVGAAGWWGPGCDAQARAGHSGLHKVSRLQCTEGRVAVTDAVYYVVHVVGAA